MKILINDLKWEKAINYLNEIIEEYQQIPEDSLALQMIILPLKQRYLNGERTQELYDEIMEVEYVKQNYYVPPKTIIQTPNTDILFKLVDRATPKKPIMQAMSGFRLYEASVQVCPCCKELIINVWTRAEYQPNYCHYCGQALDWSDSD